MVADGEKLKIKCFKQVQFKYIQIIIDEYIDHFTASRQRHLLERDLGSDDIADFLLEKEWTYDNLINNRRQFVKAAIKHFDDRKLTGVFVQLYAAILNAGPHDYPINDHITKRYQNYKKRIQGL